MRTLAIISIAFLLAGCGTFATSKQRGGHAQTVIPSGAATVTQTATDTQPVATLPPTQPVSISLSQPDNPEGRSTVDYEETTTTTAPDGVKVVTQRKTRTEVGGSQDLARIIKESAKCAQWRSILLSAALLFAAWLAFKREWPLVAGLLAVGAFLSLFLAWWAGLVAVADGALVYLVYQIKPIP